MMRPVSCRCRAAHVPPRFSRRLRRRAVDRSCLRSRALSARAGHVAGRLAHRFALVMPVALLALVLAISGADASTVHVVALAASVEEVLNNIRNWIMGILALVATVFLTIGGVRYVLAGGDPGEVGKAKEAFKSAGMGYVLAALAPLVVQILRGIVGA